MEESYEEFLANSQKKFLKKSRKELLKESRNLWELLKDSWKELPEEL